MEELELSTMLKALRAELFTAQQEGEGSDIKFLVNDVELEVQLGIKKDASVKGGVKFWVYEAEVGGSLSSEKTHRIKMRITPEVAEGKPLKLSHKVRR